jgi:hypothetical protein
MKASNRVSDRLVAGGSVFGTTILKRGSVILAIAAGLQSFSVTSEAQQVAMARRVVLRAGRREANTRIPRPEATLRVLSGEAKPTARFEVTYDGFEPKAKEAFKAAVDVWSSILKSDVPIRVEAHWVALGPGDKLGEASPAVFWKDFPNAPMTATEFPIALANKLAKADLGPGKPHILAYFNGDFENWYLETNGQTPPGKCDFMSAVLHELGHGIGFVSSMAVGPSCVGNWGINGASPTPFDRFVENQTSQAIIGVFANSSVQLGKELQSGRIYFNGSTAIAAAGAARPKLYAPAPWIPGSSFSHLDEDTYRPGNPNSLMTPFLDRGEAIHSPGPITLGILKDLGW